MVRGSILVLLATLAAGCTNYRSRGQGPFADRPRKSNPPPAALPPVIPPRTPAPVTNPMPPAPPAEPGPVTPVPPRSPEPTPTTVAPPTGPRPPVVSAPPQVAAQPAPAAAPAAGSGLAKLADTATKRWATIDTFEAKLTRREVVRGAAAQTEEVIVQLRREPYAVYMRNTGEVGRGREVLYNPSRHEDKVHAIVGEGDSRLYKAGNKAPSLSPDSPLVKNKSRRSIRDAGPGTAVALFARLTQAGADLKYVGPVQRPEFPGVPLELVEQTVRPGAEPDAERGGIRSWYFDAKPDSPAYGLPVLMTLVEAGSTPPRELEYYCYTQVKAPAGLTDADFGVERLSRPRR